MQACTPTNHPQNDLTVQYADPGHIRQNRINNQIKNVDTYSVTALKTKFLVQTCQHWWIVESIIHHRLSLSLSLSPASSLPFPPILYFTHHSHFNYFFPSIFSRCPIPSPKSNWGVWKSTVSSSSGEGTAQPPNAFWCNGGQNWRHSTGLMTLQNR